MWKFALGIFVGCLLTTGIGYSDSLSDYYQWESNRLLREQNRIMEQQYGQSNQYQYQPYQPFYKNPC